VFVVHEIPHEVKPGKAGSTGDQYSVHFRHLDESSPTWPTLQDLFNPRRPGSRTR
jgi:hypothetical protein